MISEVTCLRFFLSERPASAAPAVPSRPEQTGWVSQRHRWVGSNPKKQFTNFPMVVAVVFVVVAVVVAVVVVVVVGQEQEQRCSSRGRRVRSTSAHYRSAVQASEGC